MIIILILIVCAVLFYILYKCTEKKNLFGLECSIDCIISMDTSVSNNDGVPCYEITLFNRVSEHIACHEVKAFEVYHRDLEWEHYKSGMRCPKCESVVKMRFDRHTPLIFCPYCGNKNTSRGH